MNEFETRPGVFVTPMSKDKWMDRACSLSGEDKIQFVARTNWFNMVDTTMCETIFAMKKHQLTALIIERYPEFNPLTDVIFVRYHEEAE